MILQGVFQQGEQLVQEALAERLGLSRTPLRKAIATLAQEGLVELTPRGVAYVRSFTGEELVSIWEIRAVLEGLVCRLAARKAQPHHVAYLRSLITSAAERVSDDDWTPYRKADREFHSFIPTLVNDPLLARILDGYQILSISLAQGLLRPPHETLPEHIEILDAIDAGDADRAERVMVQHIRASMEHLRSHTTGAAVLPIGFLSATEEVLARLAHSTRETVAVVVRQGAEAHVLAAEESERMLRIACAAEARFPLHATAAGKVLLASESDEDVRRMFDEALPAPSTKATLTSWAELLAALEEIRRAGHATEKDEHEEGVSALAVPILHRAKVIAALSVLVPTPRYTKRSGKLLGQMKEAADGISRALS